MGPTVTEGKVFVLVLLSYQWRRQTETIRLDNNQGVMEVKQDNVMRSVSLDAMARGGLSAEVTLELDLEGAAGGGGAAESSEHSTCQGPAVGTS